MKRKLALGLLLVGFWASCSSDSGEGNRVSTNQLSVSQAIQFYRDQVADLLLALNGSQNCIDFLSTLQSLTATLPCSEGGIQITEFMQIECTDAMQLDASASINWTFQSCQIPGANISGAIQGNFFWDGQNLTTELMAQGFLFNGLPQSFSNLVIDAFPPAPLECEGQIIIAAEFCPVTPDCQFCPI